MGGVLDDGRFDVGFGFHEILKDAEVVEVARLNVIDLPLQVFCKSVSFKLA